MTDSTTLFKECLAAGLGCAIADGTLNFLEVTKLKLQLQSSSDPVYHPPTMSRVVFQTVSEDGFWKGLAQPGLTATLLRAMTYVAFRIGTYPTVRDRVVRYRCDDGDEGSDAIGTAPTATATITLSDRLLAGAITGGIGSMLFTPIDVVRLRLQADAGTIDPLTNRLRTGLRRGHVPRHNRGTVCAFGEVWRNEGGVVRGWYRGASTAVARATVLSACQLASYECLKSMLRNRGGLVSEEEGTIDKEEETMGLHMVCALGSGWIAQTVVQPIDTLRSFVMGGKDGRWSELVPIVRSEGVLRWAYRGYLPAMARQGPIMLFQLPLIEQFRALLGVGYL